ncbi:MAG: NAD-dependent epimerase/dehydratase family protein [Chloroflexaceae bacterium]|nr:NAD-dependent epimerase/dehydratase family protein [Chloroflexaceae bacterium]
MKTSLVTGGAGFIGSHVVDELIAMGHRVVVLDDLSGGFLTNVPSQAQFVKGSIVDHQLVDNLFETHRFTDVFHLGAYAAEGLSHFIKRFNYTNNLIGSVNLINAAVNSSTVRCLVFTSSIAVYGRNQLPMTEDLTPRPEDPYGIAKYAVEQDLHQALDMFGLPFLIFRPHNVYGERQNIADRYRNVIGIFMNQAMKGEPFTIFGDGTQTRAFSHVDDVAPIIARAVERPETYNQVYNIGADRPYSINELASVVAEAMEVPLRVRYLDARHEVLHAFSSHERARQAFGDLFRNVPLEAGVQRMARWCRQHGSRETKPFTSIEVARGMPPSWAAFQQDAGEEG